MSLSEKLAIVTGAGSGIGRAVCEGFTRDGARVMGFGRTEKTLRETQDLCPEGSMEYISGDVSLPEDVERLFDQCRRSYGRIDILFNSAGVNPMGSFAELSHDVWAQAIQINLLGVELCCREALKDMMASGYGRIVNMGSRSAVATPPNASAYAVSKAALAALTRGIAREIDRQRYPDILINDLIPGITRSNMSPVGQDPKVVYAFARQLVTLPSGGATGQVFFHGKPVNLWNEKTPLSTRVRAHLRRLRASLRTAGPK